MSGPRGRSGPARVTRHAARKHALDILYQADLTRRPIAAVLAEHRARKAAPEPFTVALVQGVAEHQLALDALLGAYARGWTLERMPVVDRNLLRLGLYELLHTDVPGAVAVDEAVELAKTLSTDDSPRFVNGVLARALRERET